MRLEFFIGLRYLQAKSKRRNLVSLMSLLSVAGVFLGVMVPIVVMSVLLGFQKEMRSKILGVKSHVSVFAPSTGGITNYEDFAAEIRKMPGVVSVNPFIETEGLIQFYSDYQPAIIRGMDASAFDEDKEFQKTFQITSGSRDFSHKYFLLMGQEMARKHLVDISNRVNLLIAKGSLRPGMEPQVVKGMVVGTFKTGYYEYDSGIIYTSLRTLQDSLDMEDKVTQIDIKLANLWKAEEFASLLMQTYGYRFSVYSWGELNANLFKALTTERAMLSIIVIFILLVAIFNVMGSQIMLVLEKQKEIGILKTLGMKPGHIARIFLFENMLTTAVGSVLGAVMGTLLAMNVSRVLSFFEFFINGFLKIKDFFLGAVHFGPSAPSQFHFFPKGVYYLDQIPVDISLTRTLALVVGALVLSALAGLLPALRAARLRPLEVIRYE